MANHMRCIGFDISSKEEFLELARKAVVEAKKGYRVDEGCYLFVWRVGQGVELWS